MDIAKVKSNLIYSLTRLKESQYISEEMVDKINEYLTTLEKTEDEIKITEIQNEYNQLSLELERLEKLYKYNFYFIKPSTIAHIDKVCRKLLGNPSEKMTLKSIINKIDEQGVKTEKTLNSYIEGTLAGSLSLSSINSIRDYAFYNYSELTEFNAPKAQSIGKSAFVGCTALTKINIPLATSCDSSFDSTMPFTEFTAGFTIADWKSTSSANQPTFHKNSNIQMISLPGVTNIYDQAFLSCNNLKSAYFMSSSGKDIRINAFKDCKNLTTISAPHFSGTIHSTAFVNCQTLSSINFPEIIKVSHLAFQNCNKLETVKLPKCTTLSANAFSGAFNSNSSVALEIDIGISATQAIFSNKSNLKTVTMSRAQTIDTKAFMDCKSLENTSFEEVIKINDSAFQNCEVLSKFETPKVSTIGQKAFMSCQSLNYINITSCTAIGANAFNGCKELAWDFIIAPSLNNIGASAFNDCVKIKYIDAPECNSIGSYPFMNCPISYVKLGKITTLPANVLQKTSGITALDLPICTTINGSALLECVNLSYVSIPQCTKIQTKAFYNNHSLSKIILEKINVIEQSAFANCSALSQMTILASAVPTLSNINAFSGTASEFKIYVPESMYNKYSTAANWSTMYKNDKIRKLTSPILSTYFTIIDMGNKGTCFQSYIQQDYKNFTDMSIGYNSSEANIKYDINGFHLKTPFYKNGSIAFYGHCKYCPIASDNCTIIANKYVYDEATKMYSEATENKYVYYTTDEQNLDNQNKWVKVNSFDEILVDSPSDQNNLTTGKTFIIGCKSGEE